MTSEVRKLHHIGIDKVPKRSTLSDANARRSEKFFEDVYRDLYQSNRDKLSSDSRRNFFNMPDADMKRMFEDAAESPPNGEECE